MTTLTHALSRNELNLTFIANELNSVRDWCKVYKDENGFLYFSKFGTQGMVLTCKNLELNHATIDDYNDVWCYDVRGGFKK